jgi:NTP pyrophosphatase (non-canonical NTP hydrolase)
MDTFDEYQREAARTGGSDLRDGQTLKGMSCAGLGLAGEAGEVADIIKKVVHHGRDLDTELEAKLKKELGDVLWYAAHLCNVLGWSLSDVAAGNVEKLRTRYPNGFSLADSIAKRDEGGE